MVSNINRANMPSVRVKPAAKTPVSSEDVKIIAKTNLTNSVQQNSSLSPELSFFASAIPSSTEMYLYNEDDSILHTFKTKGDGSCGIHALLGSYRSKSFSLENVRKKRIEISNFLKDAFKIGTIPEYFEKAMIDYVKYPNQAPSEIKKILKQKKIAESSHLIQELMYNRETTEVADECARELIRNLSVQEAYLKHLRNKSSYLSSDEVGAIALLSEKNLRVYQGDKKAYSAGESNYYHAGDNCEIVEIYLDEARHFERACKIGVNNNVVEVPQQNSEEVIIPEIAKPKVVTPTPPQTKPKPTASVEDDSDLAFRLQLKELNRIA